MGAEPRLSDCGRARGRRADGSGRACPRTGGERRRRGQAPSGRTAEVLNAVLPDDVAVVGVAEAAPTFPPAIPRGLGHIATGSIGAANEPPFEGEALLVVSTSARRGPPGGCRRPAGRQVRLQSLHARRVPAQSVHEPSPKQRGTGEGDALEFEITCDGFLRHGADAGRDNGRAGPIGELLEAVREPRPERRRGGSTWNASSTKGPRQACSQPPGPQRTGEGNPSAE